MPNPTMQATPGPWRVEADREGSPEVWAQIETAIATVYGDFDNEVTLANARLIAAAPALRDTLAMLIRAVNVKDPDPLVVFAAIEKARAVLDASYGDA